MTRYAENTSVSAEKSRAEIERTLQRYGADGFMYGWEGRSATVIFRLAERMVKFHLYLPNPEGDEFVFTPSRKRKRDHNSRLKAWEQATRQKWRALALVIKAKLEAVESGITTFEEEFLAHIMLPNGSTVGEYTVPQIEAVYKTGEMPKLLPGSME